MPHSFPLFKIIRIWKKKTHSNIWKTCIWIKIFRFDVTVVVTKNEIENHIPRQMYVKIIYVLMSWHLLFILNPSVETSSVMFSFIFRWIFCFSVSFQLDQLILYILYLKSQFVWDDRNEKQKITLWLKSNSIPSKFLGLKS